LYLEDGENIVLIGSNAGNEQPPAWALNLVANSDATVQIGRDVREVRARLADGQERDRLWQRMNRHYEGFDDYRVRTTREIKVLVLEPR
jgi:deazaflavin-dependent oxidoreductase (nitroreductase family)